MQFAITGSTAAAFLSSGILGNCCPPDPMNRRNWAVAFVSLVAAIAIGCWLFQQDARDGHSTSPGSETGDAFRPLPTGKTPTATVPEDSASRTSLPASGRRIRLLDRISGAGLPGLEVTWIDNYQAFHVVADDGGFATAPSGPRAGLIVDDAKYAWPAYFVDLTDTSTTVPLSRCVSVTAHCSEHYSNRPVRDVRIAVWPYDLEFDLPEHERFDATQNRLVAFLGAIRDKVIRGEFAIESPTSGGPARVFLGRDRFLPVTMLGMGFIHSRRLPPSDDHGNVVDPFLPPSCDVRWGVMSPQSAVVHPKHEHLIGESGKAGVFQPPSPSVRRTSTHVSGRIAVGDSSLGVVAVIPGRSTIVGACPSWDGTSNARVELRRAVAHVRDGDPLASFEPIGSRSLPGGGSFRFDDIPTGRHLVNAYWWQGTSLIVYTKHCIVVPGVPTDLGVLAPGNTQVTRLRVVFVDWDRHEIALDKVRGSTWPVEENAVQCNVILGQRVQTALGDLEHYFLDIPMYRTTEVIGLPPGECYITLLELRPDWIESSTAANVRLVPEGRTIQFQSGAAPVIIAGIRTQESCELVVRCGIATVTNFRVWSKNLDTDEVARAKAKWDVTSDDHARGLLKLRVAVGRHVVFGVAETKEGQSWGFRVEATIPPGMRSMSIDPVAARAVSVHGTVRDAHGIPVRNGVMSYTYSECAGKQGFPTLRCTVGADGEFEIASIPPGVGISLFDAALTMRGDCVVGVAERQRCDVMMLPLRR